MCGDSHLPPAPESNDLVAIIHPVSLPAHLSYTSSAPPPLTRTNSSSSTSSSTSTSSQRSSSPSSIQGRLRLSNNEPGNTISEFSHDSSEASCQYGTLNVRIHKFGFPLQFSDKNPVLHEFCISQHRDSMTGVRLDLGVGGDGVIGRTVSIVDSDSRVLGEGIIGRM